ncbi:MAG: T9SS type A sorting domain-containing protein, partial [Bacteroidota bacterium]
KKTTLIYPNPASTSFSLKNDGTNSAPICLSVYDAFGKMVIEESAIVPEKQIDIRNLSSGIYVVKVRMKDRTETHRLVVEQSNR